MRDPGTSSSAMPTLACVCCCREYYNLGHLERLQAFAAKHDFEIQAKGPYCSVAHGPDCRDCTTCHFCRSACCSCSQLHADVTEHLHLHCYHLLAAVPRQTHISRYEHSMLLCS